MARDAVNLHKDGVAVRRDVTQCAAVDLVHAEVGRCVRGVLAVGQSVQHGLVAGGLG